MDNEQWTINNEQLTMNRPTKLKVQPRGMEEKFSSNYFQISSFVRENASLVHLSLPCSGRPLFIVHCPLFIDKIRDRYVQVAGQLLVDGKYVLNFAHRTMRSDEDPLRRQGHLPFTIYHLLFPSGTLGTY